MRLKIEDKKYYVFNSISVSLLFFIARVHNDSIQGIMNVSLVVNSFTLSKLLEN